MIKPTQEEMAVDLVTNIPYGPSFYDENAAKSVKQHCIARKRALYAEAMLARAVAILTGAWMRYRDEDPSDWVDVATFLKEVQP